MSNDVSLIHGYSVLHGKLEECFESLPSWKKHELEIELVKCWAILESKDRRVMKDRRKIN